MTFHDISLHFSIVVNVSKVWELLWKTASQRNVSTRCSPTSYRREEHHGRVAVQSGGVSRGFKRLRRARDKRVSQATTVQADMADVVEFDLTRCDSDLVAASECAQHEQNVHDGESNTNRKCPDVTQEQGAGRDRQRRRLVLTSSQVVPDSHDRRFRHVRQAMQCERRDVRSAAESIRLLAERVGPVHTEDIPMEIRRHQWSALNVLLLWAAAEGSDEHPFVGWLVDVSERVTSVRVAGVTMRGRDAAVTGWEALRAVFKSRGVGSREALAEWIHSQGFPMPRWCAHFSARVQESILNIAIATDARGSAFENLFVQLTLEECRGLEGRAPVPPVPTSRPGPTNNDTFPDTCWEVVDSVDLGAMFEQRFPMLQSCPYHVRGRYRQAARRALEARSHAVMSQDR